MRDWSNHALSERSDHRLRIVQGSVRRYEFEVGPGEELLGRRAVVIRKSGERFDLSVSESLADGHVAKRSGSALLRIAVPASHTRQGTDVGKDFTGSNDGPFYVTRDNAKTWTNVTPRDLPEGGRVQYIEPSPHRKGSAYYAAYRYLLGDYQPYIYATDDYGKTWKR